MSARVGWRQGDPHVFIVLHVQVVVEKYFTNMGAVYDFLNQVLCALPAQLDKIEFCADSLEEPKRAKINDPWSNPLHKNASVGEEAGRLSDLEPWFPGGRFRDPELPGPQEGPSAPYLS